MYISILKTDKENLKHDRKKWTDIDTDTFYYESSDFLWLIVEDDPSVETLVLWVEDSADLTNINYSSVIDNNQFSFQTKEAMLKYLKDTDYIGTKYVDEVTINMSMTEEEFKNKYSNYIRYRSIIRNFLSS